MKQTIYKLGELFCGAGGLALAAKMAQVVDQSGTIYRCEHEWANDLDEWACETFSKNIVPDHPEDVICGSVQNLPIEKLNQIDGLMFGFPCNDYSLVGEHKGIEGEYGPLYSYGVRVLNAHNPKFFLAENVSGLSSANDGETLKMILNDLQNAGIGYNLTANLYKFQDYGVPQNRHRIIIVGFRRDLGIQFKVPAPTHVGKYITCSEAMEKVQEVPYNNEPTRHSSVTVDRLKYIPEGGNAWHHAVP